MDFLRLRILHNEYKFGAIIMLLLALFSPAFSKIEGEFELGLFLFMFLLSLICALILWTAMKGVDEIITIDDLGIRCRKKQELLWDYPWTDIEALKHTLEYRTSAIVLIPKEGRVKLKDRFNPVDAVFQLCPAAKKAVEIYCKVPIIK